MLGPEFRLLLTASDTPVEAYDIVNYELTLYIAEDSDDALDVEVRNIPFNIEDNLLKYMFGENNCIYDFETKIYRHIVWLFIFILTL